MELLIWHEALGSDDEQATEDELLARLLYAHRQVDDAPGDIRANPRPRNAVHGVPAHPVAAQAEQLQSLHFMQGLIAFTRLLQPADSTTSTSSAPSWISVALSERRFFVQEVEPQIFIALGVSLSTGHQNTRVVHGAVLRDLYEMFKLFHGSIGFQLNASVTALNSGRSGMEILLQIQTLRKRIRKARISLSENGDNAASDQEAELAAMSQELDSMDTIAPTKIFWSRCDAFFPTLVRMLDTPMLNIFHEVDGINYFPVDTSAFLSLQSFVRMVESECKSDVSAMALFYKGNALWSSLNARVLFLMQQYLRLREQEGMELSGGGSTVGKPREGGSGLWMADKYDDAFLPIWSTKTSYSECAVVQHIVPQPRRSARSLHKQNSSSLSSLISDAINQNGSSSSSAVHTRLPTGEQIVSRCVNRYRSNAACYRNCGYLTLSGYFSPSWEIAKNGANDNVWAPSIHRLGSQSSANDGSVGRTVLWHESELSILILLRPEVSLKKGIAPILQRIEDCLEKLQVNSLAATIGRGYQVMAANGSSRDKSHLVSAPFVYLNRVNFGLRSEQVPRLIKASEEDLFPRPHALLAHYLPSQTLQVLTDMHSTLKARADQPHDLSVKTVNDGWIVARRSQSAERELYALFDTKVSSVADLQDAMTDLDQAEFPNIFG